MPVRSRRFASGNAIASNTTVTLYTVPAGRTAILRAYALTNRSGTARDVQLSVRSGGVISAIHRVGGLADGASLREPDCSYALDPGDQLVANVSGDGSTYAVHYYLGGSLLEGVPE